MVITKSQFIEEFLLNISKQFDRFTPRDIREDLKIINKIYLDYLYQVCQSHKLYVGFNYV